MGYYFPLEERTMKSRNRITVPRYMVIALREILSKLYENPADAQIAASDADLDITRINFSESANNLWHNILLQSEKENKLSDLLDVAKNNFGTNPELHRLYDEFEQHTKQLQDETVFGHNVAISNKMLNMDLAKEVTEVAVCRSAPNTVYAQISGTLFVSHDRCHAWKNISHNARRLAVDPQDPATVYTLLGNGIHVSNDFGINWRVISSTPQYEPFGSGQLEIHPSNRDNLYYANWEGIFVSNNRGQTWQQCFTQPSIQRNIPWFFALDPHNVNTIVVTSHGRDIHFTEDLGKNWIKLNQPPTGDKLHPGLFRPLLFHPQNSSIWYADLGTHNIAQTDHFPKGLFVTSDLGNTWHCISNDEVHSQIAYIDYIEFVHDGTQHIVFASSANGVCYSLDDGEKWLPMNIQWQGLPNDLDKSPGNLDYCVINAQTNDGMIYMKSRRGLLKSVDNGSNWFY